MDNEDPQKFTLTPQEFFEIRKRVGLSQNDLGKVLGITSRSTIRDFEDGIRNIPTPTAMCMVVLDSGELIPIINDWLEQDNDQ